MTTAPLFTCATCGQLQWPLSPAVAAPADGLCLDCRDLARQSAAASRGLALDPVVASGLPEAHRDFLDRAAWATNFRRLWPGALAGVLPRWTYLYGPTGTGKSTLAAILLAETLAAANPGRWVLGSTLAKLWVAAEVDRHNVTLPPLAHGLLVVDEILAGLGSITPFVAGRWTDLATERDDRDQTTIVTSNLPPEELVRRLPAAGSRILSGYVLELDGEDSRLRRRG